MRSDFAFGAVGLGAVRGGRLLRALGFVGSVVWCSALTSGSAWAGELGSDSARPRIPAPSPDPAFSAPSPLLVGGFRFQTVDRGERPDRFFVGANLLLFKTLSGDEGAFWSFLSPGVHYQFESDRPVIVSVAPITYVGASGLAASLQVFPIGSGRAGGAVGASIGIHYF